MRMATKDAEGQLNKFCGSKQRAYGNSRADQPHCMLYLARTFYRYFCYIARAYGINYSKVILNFTSL